MNRLQKLIYNTTQSRTSLKTIRECRPINTVSPLILQGLFNITTLGSPIINKNVQRELHGVLKGLGTTKYYYIKTETTAKLPKALRFVYFKNELSKAEPNNIKTIKIKGFKFMAYVIQFLKHDGNGFYFIVHEQDVRRFIVLVNKENRETEYEKRSREVDYETIEDFTTAYDIKTSTDYNKIYSEEVDDYERGLLFRYCKKAGINKAERKLLKQLKRGGKTFNCYVEELEEELEEIRHTQRPITFIEDQELQKREERLIKELWKATEENNSWKGFTTTIEDYYQPVNLNEEKRRRY